MTELTIEGEQTSTPIQKPRLRLEYLDGLRGVSALYVMLFHFFMISSSIPLKSGAPRSFYLLWKSLHYFVFNFGHEAVVIFIVLSGYVLMLPIVRSNDEKQPGGTWNYIKRRANRILPPYYIALILAILIDLAVVHLPAYNPSNWKDVMPISMGAILSHFFLIYNFTPWAVKINAPMWSVAVEWQIYFFFPLLLLPMWRKAGILATVGTAFLFGNTVMIMLLHSEYGWLVGEFSIGMLAAVIGFSKNLAITRVREQWNWQALTIFLGAITYFELAGQRQSLEKNHILRLLLVENWHLHLWSTGEWPTDVLVGLTASCFIIASTHILQNHQRENRFLLFLQSSPMVKLGAFSYSLYLIHAPLLGLAQMAINSMHIGAIFALLIWVLLALPAIIGIAYLFYLAFERPFLPTHLRSKTISLLPNKPCEVPTTTSGSTK